MSISVGIGVGLTFGRSRGFNPYDLFLPGDNGFLYDFSRADALFQEATGTTPAGVDQNVGLALDVSKWGGKTLAQVLAGQPPAFIADFASGITGWSAINQAVLSNSAGKLRIEPKIGNSYGAASSPSFATVVGRSYQLSIEISPAGATNTTVQATGVDILPTASRSGTYTAIFRALATTSIVTAVVNNASGVAVSFDSISVKEIPGNHASQATSGARPVLKAGGLTRYDGSDDNLLTTLTPAAAFSMFARITVPLTLALNQLIMGSNDASFNRCFLAVDTLQRISGGVGTQSTGSIYGSGDYSGQTIVVGLTLNGTTVRLFADGTLIYEAAQSGVPTTTIPLRLGALNHNGSAASFTDADIYKALAINRALTPAEALKLSNAWSA